MKTIKLIIIAIFLSVTINAQQFMPVSKYVKAFLDSRTYFVQDNNIFDQNM